ncbi:hypothetical protein [Microcoleus sp. FACHB-672]|uniref:hypothetical protein n=1 Tax=Microcoleus sp. FACHB-672 TaxID=2692825 RepID=UPI0016883176|nr:hypothetical protein [Microcoleus sp. FACHB-672]MBD2039082.1 hypothetical protein [Microcoleus sp. FACHB-672]
MSQEPQAIPPQNQSSPTIDTEFADTDPAKDNSQQTIDTPITNTNQIEEAQKNDIQTTNIKETEEPTASNVPQLPAETSKSGALGQFFQTAAKFMKRLGPWLWGAVVLVVIIPLIGQFFIAKAFQAPVSNPSNSVNPVPPAVVTEVKILDWERAEKLTAKALQDARQSSNDYASHELDAWVNDLMERVDKSFLDWYFGYFNQKQIEYKSFFAGISAHTSRWLNPNSPTPEEKVAEIITEDFQTEFAKRVLRPQIAQLRLERIASGTVTFHLNQLSLNLSQVAQKQQIPQADWERYLSDISVNVKDTEGKMLSLSLNKLGSGAAYVVFKPLIAPLLPQIGSKVAATLAGKVGAKLATKTGTVLAGKVGTAFVDCTVGAGILLWDIWDTNHTANIEKPLLRANLAAYLHEVKSSLLNNPENGIMTVVDEVDRNIIQSIRLARSITSNKSD